MPTDVKEMSMEQILETVELLQQTIGRIIIGKKDKVELLMMALLAGGHVLLDDMPGTGKTTLAKALALCLDCSFQRIQFTPDLMPADVTGYTYFNQKEQIFSFRPGPVMNNIVLADEINRAIPRTQSSLLECMGEGQVTQDGVTRVLPQPFMVLATQNPIEQEGTFPLPEAQLDRFLFCIRLGYPSLEEEDEMLLTYSAQNHPLKKLEPLLGPIEVEQLRALSSKVRIERTIRQYILDICRATRSHKAVTVGVSPRATLNLMFAARAMATLRKRDYVLPDDVKYLAEFVLGHRLVLKSQGRLRGLTGTGVIADILNSVAVPIHGEGVFDG